MESGNLGPRKARPSVLFVCTANMIRSPIAEALFRARLQKERADWQNWRVESAGTWAPDGEPAAKHTRAVLAQKGIDISAHRAKTVTADLLEGFDLILVMEPGHKEAIQVEFPNVAERVFLVSEMEGSAYAIEDPVGRPIKNYEETAARLDKVLSRGMQRIVTLVESRHAHLEAD